MNGLLNYPRLLKWVLGRDNASPRFFYGWIIVALALLSAFWGGGTIQFGFPVILKPLSQDFGISRTVGVLGLTIATLVGDIAAPINGLLVDRKGARLVVTVSAAVTGLAFILLSLTQNYWMFLLVFGVVMGVVRPSLQRTGAQALVAKWFVRRRGRAVTYSTLGMPISAVLVVPATEWIVSNFDWRVAFLAFGVGTLLMLVVPCALLMRSTPEEMGMRPDGDPPANTLAATDPNRTPGSVPANAPEEISWEAQEALHSRAFWMLALGFATVGLAASILPLHMFPYFTDIGLTSAEAASASVFFGVTVISSRLLFWGYLLERLPIQRSLVLWGTLMTAALVTMLAVRSLSLAYLAAMTFGLAMGGTAPLNTITLARYFGRAQLGTIIGVATLTGIANSVLGPLMPSVVFDITGSYQGAFAVAALMSLAGILTFALAGAPQAPMSKRTTRTAS